MVEKAPTECAAYASTLMGSRVLRLNEDIPYSASSYQAKWSKYHRDNPGISEFQYLKKLLVLKKIELREKNLPARNFTTSFSGKLLTVEELRAKLFNLFEQ